MMPEPIRCAYCPAKTLAVRFPDGSYEIRHKGRRTWGTGTIKIECEDCGAVTCSEVLVLA